MIPCRMPSDRASGIERLRGIFRTSLGLPPDAGVDELNYQTQTWDSVAHLRLVTAIEAAFGVMYETDDILGMSSFVKAVETLRRLGADL